MAHWNHRIVRHHYPEAVVSGERELLEIHEVLYNDDESLHLYRPVTTIYGNSIEELRETLAQMERALSFPILDEKNFEKKDESS